MLMCGGRERYRAGTKKKPVKYRSCYAKFMEHIFKRLECYWLDETKVAFVSRRDYR